MGKWHLPLGPVLPICPMAPKMPGMPRGPGGPCRPCSPGGPGGPGGPGSPITPTSPKAALLALTATSASCSVRQTQGKGCWCLQSHGDCHPAEAVLLLTLQHLQDHINNVLVPSIPALGAEERREAQRHSCPTNRDQYHSPAILCHNPRAGWAMASYQPCCPPLRGSKATATF